MDLPIPANQTAALIPPTTRPRLPLLPRLELAEQVKELNSSLVPAIVMLIVLLAAVVSTVASVLARSSLRNVMVVVALAIVRRMTMPLRRSRVVRGDGLLLIIVGNRVVVK